MSTPQRYEIIITKEYRIEVDATDVNTALKRAYGNLDQADNYVVGELTWKLDANGDRLDGSFEETCNDQGFDKTE